MAKKKAEKSFDELLEEALVKEDEQPYVVPGNWVWVKFDTALLNVTSSQKKLKQRKYSEIGRIPVVDQGAKLIGGHTTQKDLQYDGELPVIIFGDHTRIVKFIDFVFVQGADGVKVLLPRQIFVPEFSYYFLKNLYIPCMGYRRHFKFLMDASFSLPPLPEQKRIVKKLSSMLGRLKEARELIQEAKKTFEERRAAILNKAFTGELTKKWRDENPDVENTFIEANEFKEKPYLIPATWKWIEFCDLTKETKIGLVRSVKEQSNSFKYAYLKMNNITIDGTLDINDITKVNASKDEVQAYSLKDGDLLFNTRNSFELVGKNTVFKFLHKENVLFNNNIMRIRFLPDVYPKLISHFLNSSIGKLLLNGIKKCTTNVAAIYAKNLNTVPIPLPPKEEQKEIVRILEKLLDHEDEARTLIDMEEQIDLLEKSILSKAFRGELGTNDTNDEPAIELLKKSLNEKPKAAKKQDK